METPPADYDGAWKETLELYWRPFMELCFPDIAADIDWSQPFEFLDKELQDVVRAADSGRRFVDKLVKVIRRSGAAQWVLVHVEVQSDPDPSLPSRMYQYHYRLTDRYPLPIVSLAVLADDRAEWRPEPYTAELWGCRVHFAFRWRKLLEFSDEFLEGSENSVATVIAAQRAAQRTAGDPTQRQRRKMQLVRQLYTRGYDRQQVLDLFRLIDWQMALPGPLEIAFQREVVELEKEQVMPYVTSIERLGVERGREEGMKLGRQEGIQLGRRDGRVEAAREAVEEALRIRFGEPPEAVSAAIAENSDLGVLREWLRLAITAPSLEAFSASIHLPLRNGLDG